METQVIVVGGGPVGLLLAAELRLGGADVVVLERLSQPSGEPRAHTVDARTMEIFGYRGLLDRLGVLDSSDAGHFGGVPLDLSRLPTAYPGQWHVPQARVEEVLRAWATELGADLRLGHDLRGLAAGEDQVEATAEGPRGPVRLRAAYLVGCDGEESTVRRLAEFDFPGLAATRELLLADVSGIDLPDRRFQRRAGGLVVAARRGNGVTRLVVHEFGRTPPRRTAAPGFPEVAAAWSRVTGEDIGGGTPLWVTALGNGSRHVSRYRKGRVLLAGDAAHQQMPAGGQAVNLGLQDAANLGWKLAAQVRGWAPAGLLDTYHSERHPVIARALTGIRAQALLLLGGQDAAALQTIFGEMLRLGDGRDRIGSMITGLDVHYPAGDGHPLLGRRMPPVELVTEAGPSTSAVFLAPARGVLLDLAADEAAHAQLRAAARPWAGRVSLLTATPGPAALQGIDALLVRPDGHVAWVEGGAEKLTTALRRWFGEPQHHPSRPGHATAGA
jgi:2-polyprenyl-6-methoxyphenol hydroxylase-like FAD-dependent oxidoreductase